MAAPTSSTYSTGVVTRLFDVGQLSYNGVVFGPLFESNLSGAAIKDKAGRTVVYDEYTLTVDGYVTMADNGNDTDSVMQNLANRLNQQGRELVYVGRGFDFRVNVVNKFGAGSQADVAWGPVPELMDFQTMGAGRSAKIKWRVKFRVAHGAPERIFLLQLNYDSTVHYGEDGYSSMSLRGTMEIPLNRNRGQNERQLLTTVDAQRRRLEDRILAGIDLSRFRVTRREFNVSRDKRTLDWSVDVEERPYMDMPPTCTVARGSYSVRPARAGQGLALWLCSLKATYTVRADAARRNAWVAFLALLRLRMQQSALGVAGPEQPNPPAGALLDPGGGAVLGVRPGALLNIDRIRQLGNGGNQPGAFNTRKAWLVDFNFDEGLYLDSKTVTFSATWRLSTTFAHILRASGLWNKLEEHDAQNRNLWSLSMADVSGTTSWLTNRLDPAGDVIVDFGGP